VKVATACVPRPGASQSSLVREIGLLTDWFEFYLHEQGSFDFRFDGSDWSPAGRCPFCKCLNQGLLRINKLTGNFICESCQVRGDPIDYVQRKYVLSSEKAVQFFRSLP